MWRDQQWGAPNSKVGIYGQSESINLGENSFLDKNINKACSFSPPHKASWEEAGPNQMIFIK